jgi:hypothetical protein
MYSLLIWGELLGDASETLPTSNINSGTCPVAVAFFYLSARTLVNEKNRRA